MPLSRRHFLRGSVALSAVASLPPFLRAIPALDGAFGAAEKAHTEIWRRFVDAYDVVLDYTNLDGSYERATPEECRLGQPNALGWWTPIENGAMFNGQYMDAAVLRAQRTGDAVDKAKARRLAEGLLRLSSVGELKGFVARGFATDGKTSYPMGSNDQTGPWFYGLWRYLQSGLADSSIRARIIAKMTEIADVLEGTKWRMPAAEPFGFRGSFAEAGWDGAPRLLFLMKAMHVLTGDAKWARHYENTLQARHAGQPNAPTFLETCGLGVESRPKKVMWTGAVSVACLRELWGLERDERIRSVCAQGLSASAEFAATVLPRRLGFDLEGKSKFEGDWRKLLELWKPQNSIPEAESLALAQLAFKNKLSPRRREETEFVREPAYAAWIVSLCPDRAVTSRLSAAALSTIAHYRYEGLRYSQFFAVECAAERFRESA